MRVGHIGSIALFGANSEPKKANKYFKSSLHKRHSVLYQIQSVNMQSEEQNNSTESLESLQYTNPSQVVLESGLSEVQSRVYSQGTNMGELKRPLQNDDDDNDSIEGTPDLKSAKKTRGRVKIDMKFINNKLRRYTTFSKRKTGIMKKVRVF